MTWKCWRSSRYDACDLFCVIYKNLMIPCFDARRLCSHSLSLPLPLPLPLPLSSSLPLSRSRRGDPRLPARATRIMPEDAAPRGAHDSDVTRNARRGAERQQSVRSHGAVGPARASWSHRAAGGTLSLSLSWHPKGQVPGRGSGRF